jgi:hypothetical protein
MDQEELNKVKEWLRIDGTDEDTILSSLILSSRFIIKQSTGVKFEDLSGKSDAIEVYRTIQRLIITDLYENRSGSGKLSPVVISLCKQLEIYKTVISSESGAVS